MNLFKSIAAAAVVAAGASALATPAGAVITTFATYRPVDTAANVRFVNSGANGATGTSGTFYTTASRTATTPGVAQTRFSFLQPGISSIIDAAPATFSLTASLTNTPATLAGNTLIQDGLSGSFEFRTTQAYTVGNIEYAAGSLLLRGVFTGAQIVGQRNGTSANFSATTGTATPTGESLVYTSDFLSFPDVTATDFSISLTSVQSVLQASPTTGQPTRALRSFRGVSSGNFSVDPAPLVNALVPEPAIWGMMILGFGLVGTSMRVRRRQTVAA